MVDRQLDEISKGLLGRYINKAVKSHARSAHGVASKDTRSTEWDKDWTRMDNREKGIKMAVKKLTKEDEDLLLTAFEAWLDNLNEETQFEDLEMIVEAFAEEMQLDEISKGVLGSYIKKAALHAADAAYKHGEGKAVAAEIDRFGNRLGKLGGIEFRDELQKKGGVDSRSLGKHYNRYAKRIRGINMATARLTKEDFDQLATTALDKKPNEFIEAHHEALRAKIAGCVAAKKYEMQQALFGQIADEIYQEEPPVQEAEQIEEGKSKDSDEGRRKFDKFKKYSEHRKEKACKQDMDESELVAQFDKYMNELPEDVTFDSLDSAVYYFAEEQQLDEISAGKLGKYIAAASADATFQRERAQKARDFSQNMSNLEYATRLNQPGGFNGIKGRRYDSDAGVMKSFGSYPGEDQVRARAKEVEADANNKRSKRERGLYTAINKLDRPRQQASVDKVKAAAGNDAMHNVKFSQFGVSHRITAASPQKITKIHDALAAAGHKVTRGKGLSGHYIDVNHGS